MLRSACSQPATASGSGPTARALLALLAVVLAGCGGPGSSSLGPGQLDGNVFTHAGLGMRLDLPQDWAVVPPAGSDGLAQAGRSVLAGGDPTGGAYQSSGSPTSQTLFSAYRFPLGSVQGINPSLVAGLESVLARPQIQTAVDYLQMLQSFLTRGGMPMKFEPIVPDTLLAGQAFAVLALTMQPAENERVGQVYFCRRIDDHMLTLVATFATPEQWAQMEPVVHSMTLER